MAVKEILKALRLRVQVYFWRFLLGIVPKTRRFPHSRKVYVRTTDGKRQLVVLIYDPPNAAPGLKPVHVMVDGSGFIFNMHGSSSHFCGYLAREAGCIVVNGDYRKAPEWPFPSAHEDGMRILSWVLQNKDGEFDTSKVTLGGVSAGGNVALTVAGQMGPGIPKAVFALYPPIDYEQPYQEKHPPPMLSVPLGKGVVIPPAIGELARQCYVGSWAKFNDPRLCPLFADLSRYPDKGRTFIVSCEYDYLDQEAQVFKDKLIEAGREPEYAWMKGMGHGWDNIGCKEGTEASRLRDEVYAKIVEIMRRAYSS